MNVQTPAPRITVFHSGHDSPWLAALAELPVALRLDVRPIEDCDDFGAEIEGADAVLLVSDFNSDDRPELEVISSAQTSHPTIPIIALSHQESERLAVESFRRGATDYLTLCQDDQKRLSSFLRSLTPKATNDTSGALAAAESGRHRRDTAKQLKFARYEWARGVLEIAPDPMAVVDCSGRMLIVNCQMESLFEYGRGELVGVVVESLIPKRYRQRHRLQRDAYFEDPAARPMGSGLELSGLRKNGTEFPLEISLGPLQTDRGVVVLVAIRDITDRINAQQRFRGLLESVPDALVIVDNNGAMRLVNKQTELLFGYEREELIDRTVEALIPSLQHFHRQQRKQYVTDPDSPSMGIGLELKGLRKDGVQFPIEISLSPVHSDGELFVIATIRDISDRKQMESVLRRSERLASLGTLMAGIAHEINNPVGAALLTAETALALVGEPDSSNDTEACLRNIIASMDRCGRIVESILKFSRGSHAEKVACDLNQIIRQACEHSSVHVQHSQAKLSLDLSDALPPIYGVALELEVMLMNLIRNGIDSGNHGVHVQIQTSSGDGGVHIAVSDNGRGMSDQELRHVFDPFYTTRPHAGGTGLGMSIVYGIIQEHQGTIDVDSKPGVGTTVRIELPTAEPTVESHVAPESMVQTVQDFRSK